MRNKTFVIIGILICLKSFGQVDNLPDCVHYEKAGLIFPAGRDAQNVFYTKLDSLIAGEIYNLNIWQVGGSHVQGGFFSNRIMENFQTLAGKGEQGIIFPRQLADTHPDSRFTATAEGRWECPMLTKTADSLLTMRYGITGFAARTDSAARIGINTNPGDSTDWRFKKIRVLGYGSSDETYPQIVIDSQVVIHTYDSLTCSWIFELPESTDTVAIDFVVPEGNEFVLTGLMPITARKGVNYFASGVNGARTGTWVDLCQDLERDLAIVNPDLAIFGLGINDSACDSALFCVETYKNNYRRLISMIRQTSPDCAFIFITNNDSYRYNMGKLVYNPNHSKIRKAMVELAMEYDAGVWDLYGIMGEKGSVYIWKDKGLIGRDKLHFTPTGYCLLGDLLYEAIINDWMNTKR